MKELTAIDLFLYELNKNFEIIAKNPDCDFNDTLNELKNLYDDMKHVEYYQMENAWTDGYHKSKDDIICDTFSTFEKHYEIKYR